MRALRQHGDKRLPDRGRGVFATMCSCSAVVVGVFTFTEARPAETSPIGSLAAIAFAPPVVRNALPGSPPLGVEGMRT
jgi:hypothetical protein